MADPTSRPSLPAQCASNRCRRAARSGVLGRRPAEPDARLCGPCRRALAADLAALPALHRESEQHLVLPARQGGLARVTGHRPDPPPVSDAALEARHDAVVRLASWARLVLDETGAGKPPERTVPALAAFLGRHVGLLAAHPAAGPAADEIARVATALRGVVAPPRPELVPLGRCVEPGCEAEVTLPERGGDDLVLRGPMCGAGHVLTPRQWLLLNRRQSMSEAEETA
ncbi:hypothetical protein OIE43_19300 [Streptomyces pseudovenezuelae]|uniref:hypothetical protein n=1 Tax=Streptomyces pseudovenezuelae TaxID=67350 RepID=UPI002E32F357|nr:hypothetical protein [Streptomyces pseudovenezuelae]WUA89528.1 hypothetical protein OHO81_20435 [Streptomyces pseudovenezuelae]